MSKHPYVFVYGTLREGFTNPGRDVLARHGELVGTGEVEGTLFDLGSFPALTEPEDPGDRVRGEVHELVREPSVALERLDRYEGARGSNPLPYERRSLPVDLDEGPEVDAWVYVWTGDTQDASSIESGDWVEHVRDPSGD